MPSHMSWPAVIPLTNSTIAKQRSHTILARPSLALHCWSKSLENQTCFRIDDLKEAGRSPSSCLISTCHSLHSGRESSFSPGIIVSFSPPFCCLLAVGKSILGA